MRLSARQKAGTKSPRPFARIKRSDQLPPSAMATVAGDGLTGESPDDGLLHSRVTAGVAEKTGGYTAL